MRRTKGIFYALVSSTTFGLIPLFSVPLMAEGLAAPTILFYRMGIAAAIMGLLVWVSGRRFRLARRDLPVLFLLGALYALTSLGLLCSYDFIPTGMATTIHFMYPLVVTGIMALFFKEKGSVWLLIAAVLSLLGVALLSWGDAAGGGNLQGIGLVLLTVFTYAVYIVCVNRSRVSQLDSLVLTFYVLTISAAIFLLFALATSGVVLLHDRYAWGNALLLAVLPTVLSNLTLVLAVKRIGSTMTSILGSMEPLTAVLVGVFHFGERFDLVGAVGLTLVVISVIVVILQGGNSGGGRCDATAPRLDGRSDH